MRIKKKILLTILLSIFTLLFSIGGALWLIPETAILVNQVTGKPIAKYAVNISGISVSEFYYGETSPTIIGTAIANDGNSTNLSKQGTWSIKNTKLSASASTSIISTTATVIFTPNDKQYRTVSRDNVPVSMYAVAKYGSTYFSNIDSALSVANSANSGTVYSLPLGYEKDTKAKTAKTISTTTEIKSGVTLAVPYANDINGNPITNYSYVKAVHNPKDKKLEYTDGSLNNSNYLNNQVSLAENLTLTNNGTINIAGEISGGTAESYKCTHTLCGNHDHANSITAGRHGQINLNKNAKIKSNGTIECYGFINETAQNNGSEVIFEKGTGTVVFSIIEHRGGSAYFGLIGPEDSTVKSKLESAAAAGITGVGTYDYDSLQTAPFNRFYIESITANVTIKHNATLNGLADLYANDNNNVTTVKLISNSGALITLQQSSSYVVSKYDHTTHIMDLDIYGSIKLNPMSLSLRVTKSASFITVTMDVTLATTSIFFPISNYLDVSLNPVNGSAIADLTSQQVKVLPGGKLTVNAGVTVNAKSVAVYQNNDLFANGFDYHYTTNTPGKFTMNGTLNVDNLGGMVQTSKTGAVLNITQSNNTLSQEIKSTITGKSVTLYSAVDMGYTGIEYFPEEECTFTANGIIDGSSSNFVPNRIYASQGTSWKDVSDSYNNYTVNYNPNGGTLGGNSEAKYYMEGDSTTITTLPVTPTRLHYIFNGWYLEDGTKAEGITISKDTTINVHAEWTPITYTVIAYVIDESGIFNQYSIGNYTFTYESLSNIEIPLPSDVNVGWHLNQTLTEPLENNTLTKSIFDTLYSNNKINNNSVSLYGASLPMYKVTFDTGGIENIATKELLHGSELDLSSIRFDIDNDTEKSQYFSHWELDGIKVEDSTITVTSNMTLVAKFTNKTKVSFVQKDASGTEKSLKDLYYKPGTEITDLDKTCPVTPAINPAWTVSSDGSSATATAYVKNTGWTLGTTTGITSYEVETEDLKFIATFTLSTTDVTTYYKLTITTSNATVTVETAYGRDSSGNEKKSSKSTFYIQSNKTFTIAKVEYSKEDDRTCTLDGTTRSEGYTTTMSKAMELKASSSCIAAGTLITLADGTQKKVEDIVETDILLVFDHETGKYVESAITFIERDGWDYYNVINLEFSNGTKTRLIYEHGLFDLTLNKYVYIDEFNYESFIGHEFAMIGENGNAYETVTLNKAYVTNEYTGCYSLVTMYHLNYFIDGLFSMPGGISGLFNYFEYGEGLKYDEEQMQADIEKYGLFTYEDFEDLIPYEIYEYAFPAKYYKISIAKGLMTWEDIINMIEIYLIKNGVM